MPECVRKNAKRKRKGRGKAVMNFKDLEIMRTGYVGRKRVKIWKDLGKDEKKA